MRGERLTQVLSLVAIIAVWALLALVVGSYALPGPQDVVGILGSWLVSGRFIEPLTGSMTRSLAGFVLAFAIGVPYGIFAARSAGFYATTSLLLNIVLFVPTLVVVFAGLAVLGFTSPVAVPVITGIVVAPSIGVYVRDAMRDVDDDILVMAESFKATTMQRVRDVYLPHLTPALLGASRIGFTFTWKVVMLCEVFGFPGGLGFQVRTSFTTYNMPALVAWLVIFVAALLVVEQFIRWTEKRVVRWV